MASSPPIGPACPVAFPALEYPEEGKEDEEVEITKQGEDKRENKKVKIVDNFCDHDELISTPFKN